MPASPEGSSVDSLEVGKFQQMAAQWWDPEGKFAPLHRLNPVRLAYIREFALARFGLDAQALKPFVGLNVLDIGCGGGLLCEPMARLGATVVGADAGEKAVAVARAHAAESGLDIDYRVATAEALAAGEERFDIVLNMEVVEHVEDVPLFLESCCALVRPGGLMVVSTINRTARAFALAVVGAEYVLRWLPRGTHSYKKFVTPEEIASITARAGLKVLDRAGVTFNPLRNAWARSRDLGVNYMMVLERPPA